MIAALQAEAKAAGRMGVSSHPATRPAEAEAEAIGRLLRLAQVVDIPVVVAPSDLQRGVRCDHGGQKAGAEGLCGKPVPSIF